MTLTVEGPGGEPVDHDHENAQDEESAIGAPSRSDGYAPLALDAVRSSRSSYLHFLTSSRLLCPPPFRTAAWPLVRRAAPTAHTALSSPSSSSLPSSFCSSSASSHPHRPRQLLLFTAPRTPRPSISLAVTHAGTLLRHGASQLMTSSTSTRVSTVIPSALARSFACLRGRPENHTPSPLYYNSLSHIVFYGQRYGTWMDTIIIALPRCLLLWQSKQRHLRHAVSVR